MKNKSMAAVALILVLVAAAITFAMVAGCGASVSLPGLPVAIDGKTAPPYTPAYYDLQVTRAKWRKAEVLYKIGDGSSKLVDFRQMIDEGIAKWQPSLKPWVTFREASDSETPDIIVNFVPSSDSHLNFDYGTSSAALGKTDTTFDPTTHTITSATCWVSENQDPETILCEISHELGHACGIDVHSTAGGDLMYASLHSPCIVTGRDWNTMRSLYDPSVNP